MAPAVETLEPPPSDPSQRLLEATVALAEAEKPQEVAEVIATRAVHAMGASQGLVATLTEDGLELEIQASAGYPAGPLDDYRRFSIDRRIPAAEAVRTGRTLWLESRDEAFHKYPEIVAGARANGSQSWACLLMRTGGRVLGVIILSFTQTRRFAADERAYMETLASACAQSLERARLLEASRRERQDRENVLQSLNDGVITMDARGRLTYANGAAAGLFGFETPEEVLACPPQELYARFDVFDEAGQPVAQGSLPAYRALQGEPTPEIVLEWRRKGTAQTRWSTCRFLPLRGADGTVEGVVTIFREVTSLKEAQRETQALERRYQALVETAMDAIVSADAEGRITYLNPAAERMFGYAHAELVGEPLRRLMPERFWSEHGSDFARVVREGTAGLVGRVLRLVGQTKDGRELPVEVTIAPSGLDPVHRFTAILRDVTDREKGEAELLAQVDRLQTINQLTLTVGRADAIEAVYEAALGGLQRALKADRASILLYGSDGVMRFKAWTRLSDEYRAVVEGHSPWPRDAVDPQPVLVSDVFESEDWAAFRPLFEKEGIRALGFLPLLHQGALLGKCMVYFDQPHVFTEADVQLAQAVAGHVSFAIDRRKNRAALRDADENLRIVMDASPVFITYVDADRRYQYVNRRYANLFGRTRDEVLGRTVEDVVGPELYETLAPHLDAAIQGESTAFDLTIHLADGPRHLSAQYEPNRGPDGAVRGVLGVIADITERKQNEDELRAANERLQELDRLKTHFLNAVSHEMRTPLTPIQLQLDVLGAANSTPEGRKRAVDVLDRNVRRLTRLVQEMVDVSKLQAGRFLVERAPIDLYRVLLDAYESYHEPARRAGVHLMLHSSGSLELEADAQRLSQVLSNLLSNALKFTPAGGHIELRVADAPREVVVHVRDEGVGLTREQMSRLFQPFTQVHGPGETSRAGTGLGLYLCKGMVEAHGGRLWVHSDGPGKGSTFSFSLPRA